ncbi:MAG: YciI family protein [Acidobacteriota bacterium]
MEQFLLLALDDPHHAEELSPQEMQAIIAKYQAWVDGLAEAGQLVSSQKLADGEGRVLRTVNGGLEVVDGPYTETKEVVGGYFLIRAESYDAAVAIARSCPHVEGGMTMEVRRIEQT